MDFLLCYESLWIQTGELSVLAGGAWDASLDSVVFSVSHLTEWMEGTNNDGIAVNITSI